MIALNLEGHVWVMKTVYLLLAAISFALTSLGLEIDWHYMFLAVGGSLGGSMLLAYFRREKSWFEATYKVAMAAVAGLIVGSVVVKYRGMVDAEYVAAVYAASAMLMLFIARTIVGFTESNAGKITTTIIQRVFNINLEDLDAGSTGTRVTADRPSSARGKHRRSPIMPPSVVPEDTVPPQAPAGEMVQVVETTITQEKEGKKIL